MARYERNIDKTYESNPYYENNGFVGKEPEIYDIPRFEEIKERLPEPIFDGHQDYIDCYYKAWEIAFSNLKNPIEKSGFVSPFIDAAFNGCIFMWDSVFMTLFGRYAHSVFPFQKTLDNFYSCQHKDGFICRMIDEISGLDGFTRHDPSSTGPNILALSEWKYYESVGDIKRLESVYYPLRAYHLWYRKNRTWPDGSYYSSGWGCGMDNTPRHPEGYLPDFSHGHMVWVDICLQVIINCDILIKMNDALGKIDDVSDLLEERKRLSELVNEKLWDEESGFLYDRWADGRLNGVKHISAFWSLLTNVLPSDRLESMLSHLTNESEFNRATPFASLSADHPAFRPDGGYALGSSIASTSYMCLLGLFENGFMKEASALSEKYLDTVVSVFNKTGTIWENYAPDLKDHGNPAKPDFVGWSGIIPISVLFEGVFGIIPRVNEGYIEWHINRKERHGILKYPFGKDCLVDLISEWDKEKDEPKITVHSSIPVRVKVIFSGQEKIIESK